MTGAIFCLIFFSSFLMWGNAQAADFYIATDGSGTTCSKELPCSTASIPWDTVDDETSTVYLKGGAYTTPLNITHNTVANTLTIKPCSASPNPAECEGGVIFSANTTNPQISIAGNNVVIDGRTTSASTTPCDDGEVTSCNIKVDITDIDYGAVGAFRAVLLPTNGTNNVLKWMELTGKNVASASFYFVQGADVGDGTVVSNNYIHDNPQAHTDINIAAPNTIASYGTIKVHDNIIRRGSTNYIFGGRGVDIYNNIFDVSEAYNPYDVLHAYYAEGIKYIRLFNNFFDSNDQMIFLESFTSTQCNGGPCPTEHIKIYNNIFTCTAPDGEFVGRPIIIENVHYSGGEVNGLVDDFIVVNNVFINTNYVIRMAGASGEGLTNTYTDFKFVNNIYSDTSSFAYLNNSWVISVEGNTTWANETDAVFNNNLLYDNDTLRTYWLTAGISKLYTTNLTTFETDHPDYTDNLIGDPKFVSATDFNIQTDSPAKNAGMDLSALTDMGAGWLNDKDGNARGETWDIGAYEYTGADDVVAPASPTGLSVS